MPRRQDTRRPAGAPQSTRTADGGWSSLLSAGLVGDALQALADLRKSRRLTIEEALAECELLDSASSSDHSLDRAMALLRASDLPQAYAARCLAVVGSQHLRLAKVEEARRYFERASQAAEASRCKETIAAIAVKKLAGLATWVGPEAASPEVASARLYVTRAGESGTTIRFRLSLAEIEAKRGAFSRARTQLDVASGLLTRFANLELETDCVLKRATIEFLASAIGEADTGEAGTATG